MKRMNIIGLMILMTLVSGSRMIFAQGAENSVKSTLNNLFDYSKSKSYEKAALLIAYDGEDKTRNHKDALNPANKEELNQAKRKCKEIAALIELSNKYTIGKFSTDKSSGKEIYTIEVDFISGDQKLVKSYSFINDGKGFLLTNIN
ncbi:MAG: hypothetical protein ACYC5R_01935 [Melioribacteraceae bacterium]